MRYLILIRNQEGTEGVFYTQWFEAENNFNPEVDMTVIDLAKHVFTTDGKTWHEIKEDHL